MTLDVFAGQEKNELSMIEVARAILEERGRDNELFFSDLVNAIQTYLEKSDEDIRASLPYFYADLNTDGSFIPLGDNKWGLRSWYAIDEIDEEIITLEESEEDDEEPKRQKKKANALLEDDSDEEQEFDGQTRSDDYEPDNSEQDYDLDPEDDDKSEVEAYDSIIKDYEIDSDLSDDSSVGMEDDEEEEFEEEEVK